MICMFCQIITTLMPPERIQNKREFKVIKQRKSIVQSPRKTWGFISQKLLVFICQQPVIIYVLQPEVTRCLIPLGSLFFLSDLPGSQNLIVPYHIFCLTDKPVIGLVIRFFLPYKVTIFIKNIILFTGYSNNLIPV